MAEDEKTRRLNKKTCVAHAPRLIGRVPWIIPEGRCQLGKQAAPACALTQKRGKISCIRKAAWHLHLSSSCTGERQIYACGLDTLVSNQTSHALFWPLLHLPPLQLLLRCLHRLTSGPLSAETSRTQKAKSLYHLFVGLSGSLSPRVHYRRARCVQQTRANRNRCNSHRKRDVTMPSGGH